MEVVMNSPCTKVCKIKEGICTGCHRTLEQIGAWGSMTDKERQEAMRELKWPVAVVDRVGIMQRLSPNTNLPEGTKLYTHPASAATLQFGNGNLVVTGGSFDDVPAVFISPAIDLGNAPGTALSGKDAERRTDMLYGDETVLLFKTAEHASVVVGALIRGNDASADKWIKCSEQRPNVLDVWIKMTDGSVVACWSQLDGDFYWNGGGSESYILENTVTHWKPRQQEKDHD